MFSRGGNPLQGPAHDNVNAYVADWKTTPLWYYERVWFRSLYRETEWDAGCMEEFGNWGYYPYWLADKGVMPENLHIVRLEEQRQQFRRLLDIDVEIPVTNDTTHKHYSEYFDAAGLAQVGRLYSWSIANHYVETT